MGRCERKKGFVRSVATVARTDAASGPCTMGSHPIIVGSAAVAPVMMAVVIHGPVAMVLPGMAAMEPVMMALVVPAVMVPPVMPAFTGIIVASATVVLLVALISTVIVLLIVSRSAAIVGRR